MSTDKITCSVCGKENVPDWDGQGHCIKCARDLVLGDRHPSSAEEDERKALELDIVMALSEYVALSNICFRDFHGQEPGEDLTFDKYDRRRRKAYKKLIDVLLARDRTKAQELLARLKAEAIGPDYKIKETYPESTKISIRMVNQEKATQRQVLDNLAKELE